MQTHISNTQFPYVNVSPESRARDVASHRPLSIVPTISVR